MIITWGFLLKDKNISPHTTEWYETINLPLTYRSFYNAVASVRNNSEIAIGINQPTNSTIKFGCTSHSGVSQHFYGIYYISVGI